MIRSRSTTRRARRERRGVASVLAMMFMVIFSSLAAAMAIVAQGNMRTADSALKVSRAMSAAETGLVFANRRLRQEATRFVVEKGVIDGAYAHEVWLGTFDESADGDVEVLDHPDYTPVATPTGLMYAVRDSHLQDNHSVVVEPGDAGLPSADAQTGTLRVRPITLGGGTSSPYFRLTYQLVVDGTTGDALPLVRVTSQGVDGDVTRTLQMDFELEKKIEFAVISPNRIMIGKNVRIEGPLGTRFGLVSPELETANGDPLVLRSDFYFLDSTLNANLDLLFQQIAAYDVDGDNRLRPGQATEAAGLVGHSELVDYNGDEYVDDFDLFLVQFDANSDQMVVYDQDLANAAGLGLPAEEFNDAGGDLIDGQLARLIDEALADRDGDGEEGTANDVALGYRDGVIDMNDRYAKVHGRLAFSVTEADWETWHGEAYQTVVNGAIRPEIDDAPVTFGVSSDEMREVTTDMFNEDLSWFDTEAQGDFAAQATAQGGSSGTTGWEAVPFEAPGAYDFYDRPIYENMTFTNVRIPMGTNALFRNCTFVGVTYVESHQIADGTPNWNEFDAVNSSGDLRFNFLDAAQIPPNPIGDPCTNDVGNRPRDYSNNIRFHDCTFLGSVSGDKPVTASAQYTHWKNKIQFTGETRFYLDETDDDLLAQDDAGTLQGHLQGLNDADIEEMEKSSLLLPGWSVDVGSFTNVVAADPEDTPKIKLKGTIIAGILDARGTVDIHGTLLMTFRPQAPGSSIPDYTAGPLAYGGTPDVMNTTLGYFGPVDGDLEGEDPSVAAVGFGEITLRYDPDAKLPDGIPWPLRFSADPTTYVEGGSS